jgi:hypothetical protein
MRSLIDIVTGDNPRARWFRQVTSENIRDKLDTHPFMAAAVFQMEPGQYMFHTPTVSIIGDPVQNIMFGMFQHAKDYEQFLDKFNGVPVNPDERANLKDWKFARTVQSSQGAFVKVPRAMTNSTKPRCLKTTTPTRI